MVGPATNHPEGGCQETRAYRTYGQFVALAESRAESGGGRERSFLPMFCVAMRHDVYVDAGPLDEAYEIGLFDDGDYCRRLQLLGLTLWCAESVLVHHFGEVSLGRLAASGHYGRIFAKNRLRYEEKWGVQWEREWCDSTPEYADLVQRLQTLLASVISPGESALVISRGDARMLDVSGVNARHFPQDEDGGYAGHHPADGAEAIRALVRAQHEGAQFLVVPTPSMWWLEFYEELREYLAGTGPPVAHEPDTGTIFSLREEQR